MSEFCNLLYDHHLQHEENNVQNKGINIVDFQTVGFYKDHHHPKRSLSLNVFDYEKILAPIDYEKSINSTTTPTESIKKPDNISYPSPDEKSLILKSLELSFCLFILTLCIIYFLIENHKEGK